MESNLRDCLLKIDRINQEIRDPSEFYEFVSAAELFLASEANHSIFKKPVLRALKTVKSTLALSSIVRIASLLRTRRSFIRGRRLKKLLKCSSLRDSVLRYLLAHSISKFDRKISKLLVKNRSFQSETVYEYIRCKQHLSKRLLESTDRLLVSRQLDFIANCNVYFNIGSYMHLLGHSMKLIGFKAFEAFWSLFSGAVSDVPELGDVVQISPLNPAEYCLNIQAHTLNIDDAYHFVIFGWCFLAEKYEILSAVRSGDLNYKLARLNEIVSSYAVNVPRACSVDILERDLCGAVPMRESVGSGNSLPYEPTFDHLFDSNYRKCVCDCYEF